MRRSAQCLFVFHPPRQPREILPREVHDFLSNPSSRDPLEWAKAADTTLAIAPRLSPKDSLFVWEQFVSHNIDDKNLFNALQDSLTNALPTLNVTDAVEMLYASQRLGIRETLRSKLLIRLSMLGQHANGRDLLWIMQAMWENRQLLFKEDLWRPLVIRVHTHIETFSLTECTIAWRMLTEACEDEDRDEKDIKAENMALFSLQTRRDILLRREPVGNLLTLLETEGEFLGPEVMEAFVERLKVCSSAKIMDREKVDPLRTLKFIPNAVPKEFIKGALHWAARRKLNAEEMWEITRAAHFADYIMTIIFMELFGGLCWANKKNNKQQ